jgi:hypothetical protein
VSLAAGSARSLNCVSKGWDNPDSK